jgi:hypothetical protein
MKTSSINKWLLVLLMPVASNVIAHPGHVANEQLHGFLHAEHIIMIAVIGLTLYLIKVFGKK